MGNYCFRRYDYIYEDPKIRQHVKLFDTFQISSRELAQFHELFELFDTDHSGAIDLSEFLKHMDIGVTPFGDRIFHIMDEDGSGEIDFREFVMSLWNYCTLTPATLELFAFDLYDNDSTGELSVEEVHQMLQDMYGSEAGRNHQAKTIAADLLDKGESGKFNIDMFHAFVKSHPGFLFPAFQIQHMLQSKIIGTHYWSTASDKRIKLSNGQYLRFSELLKMNVNKNVYDAHVQQHQLNDNFAIHANTFHDAHHASSAHAAAATILHHTGTHAYRAKKSEQIDQLKAKQAEQKNIPIALTPLQSSTGMKDMKFQEKKKTDDEAIASLAVYQQVAQASKTKILLPPTLESKLSTLSPRGTTGTVIASTYVSPRAEPPVKPPMGRLQSNSRQNSRVQMVSPRTTDMKPSIVSPQNTPRGKVIPSG